MFTIKTVEKLELLYGKKKVLADRIRQKEQLKETVISQEIKDKWAEIDEEFVTKNEEFAQGIAALEEEIKREVLFAGVSVKSTHLQAVFAKGRTSWDGKALEGYATAHPEIEKFKTVGDPTVSIRENKGG